MTLPGFDPSPFRVEGEGPRHLRSLRTTEGVCDRLRVVALAEQQARDAFLWAAHELDAPEFWRARWMTLAAEEDKHRRWLLERLATLGSAPEARLVRADLWAYLVGSREPGDFVARMASAEERGRLGGERIAAALRPYDPVSAELFAQIAREEVEHIELAGQWELR